MCADPAGNGGDDASVPRLHAEFHLPNHVPIEIGLAPKEGEPGGVGGVFESVRESEVGDGGFV
jgi:hypothetical protein